MQEGKIAINRTDSSMDPDAIMWPVATRGVYFKNKQLPFCLRKPSVGMLLM